MTSKQNQDRSIWFERLTIIAIVLIAGAAWFFAEIADEVIEGETHALDKAILLALRHPENPADPYGPLWFEDMVRDITALGGITVLAIITAACVGAMLIAGQKRTALLVVAAVIGGILLSMSLKTGFDRPRPELVPHGSYVYLKSFPSGHAMLSAVTYLTLGSLLAATYQNNLLRTYIIAVSVFLTFIVGISRIYLGVHWPTDVIAGWAAGTAWAALCWLAAKYLTSRNKIPPQP